MSEKIDGMQEEEHKNKKKNWNEQLLTKATIEKKNDQAKNTVPEWWIHEQCKDVYAYIHIVF